MCSHSGSASRVALYGARGSGKSTVGGMFADTLGEARCRVIHSATPLYEVQNAIYSIANVVKPDRVQDGMLLANIAREIRRLNCGALAEYVIREAGADEVASSRDIYLCDDSVIADRSWLETAGFRFVYVWAPAEVRAQRRRGRGDIGHDVDTNDPDVPKFDDSDLELRNTGTLVELRAQVQSLITEAFV